MSSRMSHSRSGGGGHRPRTVGSGMSVRSHSESYSRRVPSAHYGSCRSRGSRPSTAMTAQFDDTYVRQQQQLELSRYPVIPPIVKNPYVHNLKKRPKWDNRWIDTAILNKGLTIPERTYFDRSCKSYPLPQLGTLHNRMMSPPTSVRLSRLPDKIVRVNPRKTLFDLLKAVPPPFHPYKWDGVPIDFANANNGVFQSKRMTFDDWAHPHYGLDHDLYLKLHPLKKPNIPPEEEHALYGRSNQMRSNNSTRSHGFEDLENTITSLPVEEVTMDDDDGLERGPTPPDVRAMSRGERPGSPQGGSGSARRPASRATATRHGRGL